MSDPIPIIIPLINPNEPSARLVALHVKPGQHVLNGDRLCTLETTKSTVELTAEGEGYLIGLAYHEDQTIQAGEVLAYLADSPDRLPPTLPVAEPASTTGGYQGLRISQAAQILAQQHQLDLSQFSSEVFITQKLVQEMIDRSVEVEAHELSQTFEPNSILVYGGGGHGKALIDLIRALGTFDIAGIIDDGIPAGSNIMDTKVFGGSNLLEKLSGQGLQLAANAVGGIGNITSRIQVFERLKEAGLTCPALVHPTAFIEPSATLAAGVQVMPHAYVGSEARVGFGAIVNTGAIVSHDCTLSEFVNLSPGAILAGEVSVGEATLVGMGVTVNLRVKIGKHARIGNGATVKQDVPEGGIVRAGTVWPE